MVTTMTRQYKAARRVGTPIVAVNTPDPAATLAQLQGISGDVEQIVWDVERGGRPLTGESRILGAINSDPGELQGQTAGPPGLCLLLSQASSLSVLTEGAVIYAYNVQRILDDAAVIQAVWNVRDIFKAAGATLVMLAPEFTLPAELSADVLVLDEELPDAPALRRLVREQYKNAQAATPDLADATDDELDQSVEALTGLASFSAETAAAMSLTLRGMDVDALWDRKRKMIGATKGLSVYSGPETFDSIAGSDNAKGFTKDILDGQAPPRAIVFVDEIEKMLGGSGGTSADSSGVSQDYLGQLLSYMQDNSSTGMIFVGPPGSGKSMLAKAAGASAGVPTIQLDLGGMKGSFVGQSEQALRQALRVITAVSNGQAMFIATCNQITVLPPELRRRFGFGTFFFDLPDATERNAIWDIYTKAYDVENVDRPDDKDWTGAEIKQCVDIAWRLRRSLQAAAQYIVPVAQAAPEVITKLRTQANGRYISASYSGTYKHEDGATTTPTGGGAKAKSSWISRKIDLEGGNA